MAGTSPAMTRGDQSFRPQAVFPTTGARRRGFALSSIPWTFRLFRPMISARLALARGADGRPAEPRDERRAARERAGDALGFERTEGFRKNAFSKFFRP